MSGLTILRRYLTTGAQPNVGAFKRVITHTGNRCSQSNEEARGTSEYSEYDIAIDFYLFIPTSHLTSDTKCCRRLTGFVCIMYRHVGTQIQNILSFTSFIYLLILLLIFIRVIFLFSFTGRFFLSMMLRWCFYSNFIISINW